MSLLADPMMTEFVNGAFVLAIALGIRAVWQHGSRITALETKGEIVLTREEFHQEMKALRVELKDREDDIIARVQWTLEKFKD